MVTLTGLRWSRGARWLARSTAIIAGLAVITSLTVIAATGLVEVALFSVFAAVGGAYAGRVGWRPR